MVVVVGEESTVRDGSVEFGDLVVVVNAFIEGLLSDLKNMLRESSFYIYIILLKMYMRIS